jgi:hypothetical protein
MAEAWWRKLLYLMAAGKQREREKGMGFSFTFKATLPMT